MLNLKDSLLYRLPLCLVLLTGSALAQNNPELGDNGRTTVLPPAPAPITTTTEVDTTTTTTTTDSTGTDTTIATTGTDHAAVIGHFGVGWFGLLQLPTMFCAGSLAGGCTPDVNGVLDAPTIGARYWLEPGMAIEAALGIGYRSGSTSVGNGQVNEPSVFGLALHGGLPLVFATSTHFAFELVPELNVAFATGGWDDKRAANADADLSGFLLELGARVGAEVQFGFIGIPQLALQGSVGLRMHYEGRSATINNTTTSNHRFGFGTTVQGEPWDIFVGNIAAIYYF
jgi:hypothetical protein